MKKFKDVIGYLSENEISNIMKKAQKLPEVQSNELRKRY